MSSIILDVPSPLVNDGIFEITQSALGILCDRRFHWNVNERLELQKRKLYFDIGDLWHEMVAQRWIAIGAKQSESFVTHVQERTEPLDLLEKWHEKQIGSGHHDYDDIVEAGKTVESMWEQLNLTFPIEQDAERYRVVAVEYLMKHLIPGTRWKMVGTADLILYDRAELHTLVADHKTTGFSREVFYPDLDLSFQPWDYTWLAGRIFKVPVHYVAFFASRKSIPSIPKPLKKTPGQPNSIDIEVRRLLKGLPSCAKVPASTLSVFRSHFNDMVLRRNLTPQETTQVLPLYDHILTALRGREDENGNDFQWRKHSYVSQKSHKTFEEVVKMRVERIERERQWPLNMGACKTFNQTCPYKQLCFYGDGPMVREAYRVRSTGHYLASTKTK